MPVSDAVEELRTRVHVAPDSVHNAGGIEYAGALAASGEDNSFNPEEFARKLRIDVIEMNDEELVFDLVGVDAPIANAFRRILLAEVPTMAIEKVFVMDNTSIIQDEVLAHRLGLVPIKVDPRSFEMKEPEQEDTATNSIRFNLEVKCERDPAAAAGETEPDKKYINPNVLSHDLKWDPLDGQVEMFPEGISPVHDDILLAKMRPGQEIKLQCVCEKGVGKTHAKWSPVATAAYRLLPEIKMQPVTGDDAAELKGLCPMDVFDIEDLGGVAHAKVARPRSCTMCRECVRSEKFQKKVKLLRVRDHFIFSVETTGQLPPDVLFQEAVKVFIDKCTSTLARLDEASQDAGSAK